MPVKDVDVLARNRFIAINAVRFGGVALVVLGTANIGKHWIEPADIVGTALLAAGAVSILIIPRLLARRWRSDARSDG